MTKVEELAKAVEAKYGSEYRVVVVPAKVLIQHITKDMIRTNVMTKDAHSTELAACALLERVNAPMKGDRK